MILGGGDPAISKVHIIDLKVPSPSYVAAASLHHARFHVNGVLLPDRTVLASGGNGQSESAPTAVLEAEITIQRATRGHSQRKHRSRACTIQSPCCCRGRACFGGGLQSKPARR